MPTLPEFDRFMYDLGWVQRGRVAHSMLWTHLATGNIYRAPTRRDADFDRCIREVVMLSPEALAAS